MSWCESNVTGKVTIDVKEEGLMLAPVCGAQDSMDATALFPKPTASA